MKSRRQLAVQALLLPSSDAEITSRRPEKRRRQAFSAGLPKIGHLNGVQLFHHPPSNRISPSAFSLPKIALLKACEVHGFLPPCNSFLTLLGASYPRSGQHRRAPAGHHCFIFSKAKATELVQREKSLLPGPWGSLPSPSHLLPTPSTGRTASVSQLIMR